MAQVHKRSRLTVQNLFNDNFLIYICVHKCRPHLIPSIFSLAWYNFSTSNLLAPSDSAQNLLFFFRPHQHIGVSNSNSSRYPSPPPTLNYTLEIYSNRFRSLFILSSAFWMAAMQSYSKTASFVPIQFEEMWNCSFVTHVISAEILLNMQWGWWRCLKWFRDLMRPFCAPPRHTS